VPSTPEAAVPAAVIPPVAQDRAALLRVLYDPVSYYPAWRHAASRLGPRQRSSLNAWLIERASLPAYAAPSSADEGLCRRLVAGWDRLRQVARLLACAKQRRRLAGSRLYLAQPPYVHAFLRLPFALATAEAGFATDAELLQWGGHYLLQGLRSRVPDWLLARVALQCVGNLGADGCHRPVHKPFDPTCFWSAWNHVAYVSRPAA